MSITFLQDDTIPVKKCPHCRIFWPLDELNDHPCKTPAYLRVFYDELNDKTRRCLCGFPYPDSNHNRHCFFCTRCQRWRLNRTDHVKRCKDKYRGRGVRDDPKKKLCPHCLDTYDSRSLARHIALKHPKEYVRKRAATSSAPSTSGTPSKKSKDDKKRKLSDEAATSSIPASKKSTPAKSTPGPAASKKSTQAKSTPAASKKSTPARKAPEPAKSTPGPAASKKSTPARKAPEPAKSTPGPASTPKQGGSGYKIRLDTPPETTLRLRSSSRLAARRSTVAITPASPPDAVQVCF